MKRIAIPLILVSLLLIYCGFNREGEAGTRYYEENAPEPQPGEEYLAADLVEGGEDKIASDREVTTTSAATDTGKKIQEQRKRIYSGYCQLRIDDLDQIKEKITELAEDNGGYVEQVYQNTITIRVPATLFSSIFTEILVLGDVIYKSVETIDVTEFYTDLKSRLEIAQKTRARLYKLLEKTTDVEERLKILREIRRLTEEIEKTDLMLELVQQRINYSRITVELFPRFSADTVDKTTIPFSWIANLNPLYASLGKLEKKIPLELSSSFAVFSDEKIFRAESADGVRVRITSTENKPKGDTTFWQEALYFHLKDYYKQAEKQELGQVKAVMFTSKDKKPFSYLVGITVKENTIYLLEVFFPDDVTLKLYLSDIKNALGNMKV